MGLPSASGIKMLSGRAVVACSRRRLCTAAATTANKIVGAAKQGDVIVQDGAETAVGQEVIKLAANKGITTINILSAQATDYANTVDALKALGAYVVVDEKTANSWMFAEVISELPAATVGASCSGGAGSTAVARSLATG